MVIYKIIHVTKQGVMKLQYHLIFHITHLENLPSILARKELLAYAWVQQEKIDYQDMANAEIQSHRSSTQIPIGPKGSLHEYVPFYFAPRSPMLYSLKEKGIEQEEIVYFITSAEKIAENGTPYVFTNGHAIMRLTEFYDNLDWLDKIDWTVMEGKFWHDTPDHPNRKMKRQAEFLVYHQVPFSLILGVAVLNNSAKERVENKMRKAGIDLPIGIRPHFYF